MWGYIFSAAFLSGFPLYAQSTYPNIAGALRTPHSICIAFVFPKQHTRKPRRASRAALHRSIWISSVCSLQIPIIVCMSNANTAQCFTGNCLCMSSGKTPGHFQTRFARRFLSGFPWHAQSSYPDIAGALRTPHSICTPFVFPMEQPRKIPACFARHVVSFDLDIICMFSTNTQSSPMRWDPIHSGGSPAQPATPRRKQESGGGV